jgi:hypothetical protein
MKIAFLLLVFFFLLYKCYREYHVFNSNQNKNKPGNIFFGLSEERKIELFTLAWEFTESKPISKNIIWIFILLFYVFFPLRFLFDE